MKEFRIWHMPNVPMTPFYLEVRDLKEAETVISALADYDMFLYTTGVRGDYSNASGIQVREYCFEDWEDIEEDF